MNSRFEVPKQAINFWVDKYHVGTPDEIIRAFISKRLERAKWNGKPLTHSQLRRIEAYAIERHHANYAEYAWVMGG